MQDTRRSTGFFLSLALHALMVAVAVVNLGSHLKVDMDKPMYTVDLVSLNPSEDPAAGETGEPAGGPPTLAEGPEASQGAAPIPPPPAPAPKAEKARPEPVRDDAKAISVKKVEDKKPEKKEDKTPPKPPQPEKPAKPEEKKLSREELLKQALQDVKASESGKHQKPAVSGKDQVAGELAALRKSSGGNIFTAGGTGAGGAGGGKGAGAGGTGSGLMSVYGDIVKQVIKKNWRYAAFGTENNLAVQLELKIDPADGRITGSRVVQSSGNAIFDNSAMNAVAQTQTLPPPRTKSLDTLRITFNLQELMR